AKFDGKVNEGFLVGYSVSSKAFRVFNSRTRIVQETLHVNFLENNPNVAGSGPTWLFDSDTLTKNMNYQPVTAGNQSNPSVGFQDKFDAEKAGEESDQQYVIFPVWSSGSTNPENTDGDAAFDEKEPKFDEKKPESEVNVSPSSSAHTNTFSAAGPLNAAASPTQAKSSCIDTSQLPDDLGMLELEDITYFDNEDDVGAEADFNNLETSITVSPIPTTKVHKDHPVTQIIGDLSSATQTRSMKRVAKDQVARIEAIRLFLAYASFMRFMVYQMDVKNAFLYGTIEEEVYVCQPPGFKDPDYPDKVYKVVKELYGLHQALRACQDKYVAEILRKFGLTDGKLASTPIDTEKPLLKDPDVKRIFRYLKGKPHLGLWYLKDSPFDLVAYSDSDYASASLNRKSATGGCQFFGCRLISWQCKKQTIMGVNTPRSDEDRLELMELTVFLLPSDEKVGVEVSAVDLQFWTTVAVKKMNDVTRLQALVDKKKVVVTEALIRDALCLDDAEGVECLPNEEIFVELARMGFEKPSTKLTFYKAFFSRQKQVGDLSTHTTKYTSPVLTQKVFANMRRVAEGDDEVHDEGVSAAGIVAEGVVSAADDVVPTADEEPSIPSPTPPTPSPQPSQDVPLTSQVHLTPPQSPQVQPQSPQHQPQPSQDVGIPMDLLQNLLHTCTTLTRRVEHLEKDKIAQALEITKLKSRVKKLERRNKAS
nr:copia protein [Tanacetum cinerariifolium]